MIRRLHPSDRDELLRMLKQLWPDSTDAASDGLVVSDSADAVVLVATRPGKGLCGFAEIATRHHAESCLTSPVAYLEGLWIDVDCRRSGIALNIVHEAKSWARSKGFAEFASDCTFDNEISRAFHAAAGFDEVERVVYYRLQLVPGVTITAPRHDCQVPEPWIDLQYFC